MIKLERATTKAALTTALQIRRTVFIREMNVSEAIEIDNFDETPTACDHFIIMNENIPVGALRCRHITDEVMKPERFCLLPEHRSKGYGRAVIRLLTEIYTGTGIHTFVVHTKLQSADFYVRCGFRPVSAPFSEANVPHVKMIKTL